MATTGLFRLIAGEGGSPDLLAQGEVPSLESLGEVTLQDWITAGVIMVVAVVATMLVRRVASNVLERVDLDTGTARLVARFVAAVVFLGGLVYALNSLEIAIGPLLGALGVAGFALAFALQDILTNFISGILLQARRPFRVGDQVVVGGHEGTVEDVNLRTTVMKTFDGRRVYVPSSTVLQNPIENHTAYDRRRTTLAVGVAYDTDLSRAEQIILEAVAGADSVLPDPAPEAFVESFGGSSIDFAVRFWHRPEIADEWATRHKVALSIKSGLDDAGIEIPFPIRTLDLSPHTQRALDDLGRRG